MYNNSFQAISLNILFPEDVSKYYNEIQRKLISKFPNLIIDPNKHNPHLSLASIFIKSKSEREKVTNEMPAIISKLKDLNLRIQSNKIYLEHPKKGNSSGYVFADIQDNLNYLNAVNTEITSKFSGIHIPNYIEFLGEKWDLITPEEKELFKSRGLFTKNFVPHITLAKFKIEMEGLDNFISETSFKLEFTLNSLELTISESNNIFSQITTYEI